MRGLGLGMVVVLLALPAGAEAETYCVGSQPSCQGTPATLQVALTASAASTADDRIAIGEGTFNGPFTYAPTTADAGSLRVYGQGAGRTILTSAAPNSTVLNLLPYGQTEPQAGVDSLGLSIPDGGTGINTYGGLESIHATAQPGADDVTAIRTNGSARLHSISVTLPHASTAVLAAAAAGNLAGDVSVFLLTARAGRGIDLRNEAWIGASTIVTSDVGVHACSASAGLQGSVLVAAAGRAVTADARCGAVPASLRVGSSTIVGESGSSTALTAAGGAHVGLDSSVVRGFPHTFSTQAGSVSARYSLIDLGAAEAGSTTPAVDKGDNLDADPGFVDAAARNYAVTWASPLIDAGDPVGIAQSDAINGPRFLDGDGDDIWRQDIGAYEYAGAMPRISAPGTAMTGEAVVFDGSASTALYGPLTHAWTYDDGVTSVGPVVRRAFATPGTHSVTLTVTDSAGRRASRTATVRVSAPARETPSTGTSPEPEGVTALDTTPPRLSGVRVRRAKRLEWFLSEDATLTATLQRCRRASGRRCLRWATPRAVTRAAKAGPGALRIARTRGLWRVHVAAADASGNRSVGVTVRFRARS